MAPPPKRPTGTANPRRSTTGQARASARRTIADPPATDENPTPDATVLGMDEPAPAARADATVVFDSNGPQGGGGASGPTGRLVVLKGPKQGAEFTLGPGETSIGRNADNTIVIPDISVSRKHVVLVKQGAGWVLQDQGSGNGTLVNGAKVDEQELQDGDVFVIGDTEVQFVLQGAAPRRRSSSQVPVRRSSSPAAPSSAKPRASVGRPMADGATGQIALPPDMLATLEKKKKMRVIMVACAAIAAVLMVGALVAHHSKQMRLLAIQAKQQAQEQAQQELADDDFADGKRLVLAGKFAEALPKFEDSKAKGSDDPEVDEYIARCKREMANEKLLNEGEQALSKWQLAAAMAAAQKVPEDSLLSDKADSLKKRILAAVPQRVAFARGLITGKDYTGAKAILDDAAKVAPDDSGVSSAQDDLAKAENKPPPIHYTHRAVHAVDHTAQIIQAFKDGNLTQAKALAAQYGESNDEARRVGQEIAKFETAYDSMDTNPNAYRTAHEIDLRLSHGHSFFSQKIDSHLSAVALKQCVTAKTAGRFAEAFRDCQSVHAVDPNNGDANSVLQELSAKAKETYLEAYQQMEGNPEAARRGFHQVINTTPSSDEYHQKSLQRLQELNQQQ